MERRQFEKQYFASQEFFLCLGSNFEGFADTSTTIFCTSKVFISRSDDQIYHLSTEICNNFVWISNFYSHQIQLAWRF